METVCQARLKASWSMCPCQCDAMRWRFGCIHASQQSYNAGKGTRSIQPLPIGRLSLKPLLIQNTRQPTP